MDEEKKVKCPECGQSDAVKKLSVVYAEGMLTPSSASQVEKLGPPPKPKFNGLSEQIYKGMTKLVSTTFAHAGPLSGCFVYMILGVLPFIIWAPIAARIAWAITSDLPFSWHGGLPKYSLLIFIALIIVPTFIFISLSSRRESRFDQEHQPLWLIAVEEWSKQLYCKRCKRSFTSEEPTSLDIIGIEGVGGLIEKDSQEKPIAEQIVQVFLGTVTSGHCIVCHKESRGILVYNINRYGLPLSSMSKLMSGRKGMFCKKCGAFYDFDCFRKAFRKDVAQCGKCKWPMENPYLLVETMNWYDSITSLLDPIIIEALQKERNLTPK
jgi:hypothetical protein